MRKQKRKRKLSEIVISLWGQPERSTFYFESPLTVMACAGNLHQLQGDSRGVINRLTKSVHIQPLDVHPLAADFDALQFEVKLQRAIINSQKTSVSAYGHAEWDDDIEMSIIEGEIRPGHFSFNHEDDDELRDDLLSALYVKKAKWHE